MEKWLLQGVWREGCEAYSVGERCDVRFTVCEGWNGMQGLQCGERWDVRLTVWREMGCKAYSVGEGLIELAHFRA